MKKNLFVIISVLSISLSMKAYTTIPADTNKMDTSGKKTGFWKEKSGQTDWYGNYSNDKKEGLWIGYFSNGAINNLDEYKNGRKNGLSLAFDKGGFYTQKYYYVR